MSAVPVSRRFAAITVLAGTAAAFLAAFTPLTDPEAWNTLACGRVIARLHALPSTDILSFSSVERAWDSRGWLAQLAFHLADRASGVAGSVASGTLPASGSAGAALLKAVAAAAAFLLASLAACRGGVPLLLAPVTAGAALAAGAGFTETPAILAAPLLALEILVLARGASPVLLVPVAFLWANIDGGSVVLAPLVLILWRAGEALERLRGGRGERNPVPLSREALALLLVTGAACANPELHRVLTSPFGTGVEEEVLGGMPGGPPSPHADTAFYILIAVLVPAAAFGLRLIPLPGLVITAVLLGPALASRTLALPACLAALTVLPAAIEPLLPAAFRGRPRTLAGTLAFLAVLLPASVRVAGGISLADSTYPGGVIGALGPGIGGVPAGGVRVLAPRNWGGFIEANWWPGARPFFDPRRRTFGAKLSSEGWQMLEDTPDAGALLARYRPDLAVLGHGTRLGRRLARDRGWVLVHWDDASVAYVRTDGALRSLARGRGYRAFGPDGGAAAPLGAVLRNLERAALESPGSAMVRTARAEVLARAGRLDEAWRAAIEAVTLAPGRPGPALAAFDLALARRDREGAREMLARARATDPRGPGPRAAAAELAAAEGRPADALRAALDAVRDAEARGDRAADPGLARALRLVARLRAAAGEAVDAADSLRRAGNVLMSAGDPAGALVDYRDGLKLAPRDPRLAHNTGAALYEQGLVREALAAWREALVLNPGSVETLVAAGVACYRLGDAAGARSSWTRALMLDPRRDDVRGLILRLEARETAVEGAGKKGGN